MILKFDHISYISSKDKEKTVLAGKGEPVFREIGLQNIDNKFPMMYEKHQNHDLFFYEETIPTEYIFYDSVYGNSNIEVSEIDSIYYLSGHYVDLKCATEFLDSIFPGKVSVDHGEIKCVISGIMDKKKCVVVLSHDTHAFNYKNYLDTQGYGVPAVIYRGNIRKDNLSDERQLTVNRKKLFISFASCDTVDLVFEMIRIGK